MPVEELIVLGPLASVSWMQLCPRGFFIRQISENQLFGTNFQAFWESWQLSCQNVRNLLETVEKRAGFDSNGPDSIQTGRIYGTNFQAFWIEIWVCRIKNTLHAFLMVEATILWHAAYHSNRIDELYPILPEYFTFIFRKSAEFEAFSGNWAPRRTAARARPFFLDLGF